MGARKVNRGFIVYTDADGRPNTGYLGDEVDVHDDDLERFDSLNEDAAVVAALAAAAAITPEERDLAVQIAVEEKDAELAEARTAVEDKAREVAKEIEDLATAKAKAEQEIAEQREQLERDRAAFEAAQADGTKTEPVKAPSTKSTAPKQS